MYCRKCGKEIAEGATVCPYCGEAEKEKKKSIFKRWWFWLIVAGIAFIAIVGSAGGPPGENPTQPSNAAASKHSATQERVENRPGTGTEATGNPAGNDVTPVETAEPTEAPTESAPSETPDGKIGKYNVTIKDYRITEDSSGGNILIITYTFTNNSDESMAFMYAIEDKCFQNGVELGDVFTSWGIDDYSFDNQSKEIKPGISLDVQVAYELNDTTTDVEVELDKYFSWTDSKIVYTLPLDSAEQ